MIINYLQNILKIKHFQNNLFEDMLACHATCQGDTCQGSTLAAAGPSHGQVALGAKPGAQVPGP